MIGIIGFGFVGQALASVLQENYNVVDPKHPKGVTVDVMLASDPEKIFLCVPTPTNDQGCDDTILMQYIRELQNYQGILVVKSTAPPATVDKIMDLRPDTVIWPELLREAHAAEDFRNPRIIVIGARRHSDFMSLVNWVYLSTEVNMQKTEVKQCTPIEASVFKYTVNSFLAMKVVFMHEMALWIHNTRDEDECSWDEIAQMLALEGRVGSTHLQAPGAHGYGYSGTCFPKDTVALVKQANNDGWRMLFLEAGIEVNKILRDQQNPENGKGM